MGNTHETSINNTSTLLSLFSIFIDTSDSLPSLDAVIASPVEAKLTHQRMEETRGRNGEDRGGAILVSHSHERWNLYILPLSAPLCSEKRRLSVFACCIG